MGKVVVAQVIALIKRMTLELFNCGYVCENSECEYWTRSLFCRQTSEDASASPSKIQPSCDLCESSMLPEMDDRKMDLQLSFLKHLFDTGRERDNVNLNQPTEDLLEMYQGCYDEVSYALKCSTTNNIDAFSVFSMICSGRPFSIRAGDGELN